MLGRAGLARLFACVPIFSALLSAAPAFAQKSADRLRISINEFVPGINPYELTLDELSRVYRQVYRPLISRDERVQSAKELLAALESCRAPAKGAA